MAVAARPAEGMHTLTAANEHGMALAGFLTFADRPKAEAGTAIGKLGRLGVQVKITTGNHGGSISCLRLGGLVDATALLACQPRPAGRRIAMASNAGAPG